jgi:hypothetical protein
MSQNEHIFLSYRNIEADFALKLAADLKNIGVKLWMDRLDGIQGGDDWVQTLQNAINGCAAFIAVLSPEYIRSKYCRRELKRADTLGRTIYPVLLREITKEDWPFEIQEKQYIDLRKWHDNSEYHRRLDELTQLLRQQNPAQFGDTPDRETQYLTGLIAELEAHRGVLEYVDLSGVVETKEAERPNPTQNMGWAPEFALLDNFIPTNTSPDLDKIKRIPLRNIREAVEQHPRFMLTGEPGAGKTTIIRKLALDAARERLDNPRAAPLPLFLRLPAWSDEPTPNDFILVHWPFASDPTGLIAQGDVLLYLDGLNEMGATAIAKVKHLREWLQSKDTPKRVIITCRVADYTTDLDLNLPTVLAENMDEAHIERFAINYLGEKRAEPFLSQICPKAVAEQNDARHLSHLARNPYLLAALIYIYQNLPDGNLPRNTGQLFRSLAGALWVREQRNRTSGWVPFEEMEAAFAQLAFTMIDEDMPIEVSQDYALKHIGNSALLRAGQSANLVLIHDEKFRFYHQLIQEYFAAMALLHDSRDMRVMKVNKWRHVFVAWSSFVPNPEPFLRELTFDEAHSLARAGYNVQKKIGTLLASLASNGDLGSTDPHDLMWVPNVIRKAGKLATPYLLKALHLNDMRQRGHATYLLGFTEDPDAVPVLIKLLSDTTKFDLVGWMPRICDAAALALEHLGTAEAITTVQQWRCDQMSRQ